MVDSDSNALLRGLTAATLLFLEMKKSILHEGVVLSADKSWSGSLDVPRLLSARCCFFLQGSTLVT